MPRRKKGAPEQYRLRRVTVTFQFQENTAAPYDADDIITWFKQNQPDYHVIDVQFPLGTYWDEPPDPTVED